MKPRHRILSLFLFVALLVAGCDDGGQAVVGDASPDPIEYKNNVFDGRDSVATGFDDLKATQTNFQIATEFLLVEVDGGYVGIDDPDAVESSDLLFESREENEILTPDENQVTWGEFSDAEGAVIAKCNEKGTHLVSHFGGLIPNGVYSASIRLFDAGDGSELEELSYSGRTNSASQGIFRASADGEGHLSGFVPAGAAGIVGDCMLSDARNDDYFWQIVSIYHIDGSPETDVSGTFVEHGIFEFGDPPPVVD